MSSKFIVVIPARYNSSRLPGKPLADIAGAPMVERVWQQASVSRASRVIIATDDERVEVAAHDFGAEVIRTSPNHPNGTARLAEVVEQLALPPDTCIVNVQGDEPLLPPALIDQVAEALIARPSVAIATLAEPIEDIETLARASVVKVVRDHQEQALYFSRAPIAWPRDTFAADVFTRPQGELPQTGTPWLRHIGLYAYRASFLTDYAALPVSPLETIEQLEQLRALYHGYAIHVGLSPVAYPAGVDTQDDLERVRRAWASCSTTE